MNNTHNHVSYSSLLTEAKRFRNCCTMRLCCIILAFGLIGFVLALGGIDYEEKQGNIVTFNLTFSEGLVAPDNFPQQGILTNGMFPGPAIIVNQGDTLIVHVTNLLSTGFTLHMHGILQKGTIESDGAPHITQELIPSNSNYTYQVEIGEQSGTFMYHAHTDLDLVWAMGPILIQEDPTIINETLKYYDERTLIVSQCWHVPVSSIFEGLISSPFEDVPDSSSLLINGRSWGVWGNETTYNSSGANLTQNSEGYEVITVKQNETYRFRLIGMGVDSMLTFSVENHTNLEIIEVDGILVDPVVTDNLQINSAQRYSVLIKMDQPIGNYWITTEMLPGPGPSNGKALLHYEGAPDPEDLRKQVFEGESEELELNEWVLNDLHPISNLNVKQPEVYQIPLDFEREIIIQSFQKVIDTDNTTKFDINGILHRHTGPALLHQLLNNTDIISNPENGVFEIFIGQRVQIIFQNRMSDEGECEQHPWHIHGHTFYEVGRGGDEYDAVLDGNMINEDILRFNETGQGGFLFRDVVTLFPYQKVENTTEGAACGWSAVRLLAENTGLWLVHCHLTPHQIMGKWFVLYEHEPSKLLY